MITARTKRRKNLMSFEQALALVMSRSVEGGYTSLASDAGNWTGGRVNMGRLVGTQFGISAPVLGTWLGREATRADMIGLSREQAAAIYEQRYWRPLCCDHMSGPVGGLVFDAAVNQGPASTALMVQQAADVRQDGEIGPVTLAALNGADQADLHAEIARLRAERYRATSDWSRFGKGWMRRLMRVVAATAAFT
ncbi:putative exported protein [Granulibacter bethesdensis CGDNIH4]|nr:putative exported protein [Granulibacter bethesdensis CGDNIH4]